MKTPRHDTRSAPIRSSPHAGAWLAPNVAWKPDWDQARDHLFRWWQGEGLALHIDGPPQTSRQAFSCPEPPHALRDRWLDPAYRARRDEYNLARSFTVGDNVPQGNANVGPGDLAVMLNVGCQWGFTATTVWYEPTVAAAEDYPPLKFDPDSAGFQALAAMLREQQRVAAGRWLVGMPDLIENMDILAALRGPQTLMMDLIERPDWVREKIQEINQAFFEAFDAFYEMLADDDGGNVFSAFSLWGPGRTAKVQCDASAMISPEMFREFVAPSLTEQCQWLDYSMYHLDGEQALVHLDALLEIQPLKAIEWTPVGISRGEGGGHPKWYDLYRRILNAGKSVQAIAVAYEEVIPLLDAVGGAGMSIFTRAPSEQAAHELLERAAAYR